MEKRNEEIKESALGLLELYMKTKEQTPQDEFAKVMDGLCQGGDLELAMEILENAIAKHPDYPMLYYNAARLCENWACKLQGDYLESKGTVGMSLSDWMCGDGTPYAQCVALAKKGANY